MPKKTKRRSDFYDFYSSAEHKDFPRPKKSTAPFIVLLFFIALLSTSAWYGVTLFSKKGAVLIDPLELTINAPTEIQQGAVLEYVVHYKNTSEISFPSAEVFATYPQSFIVAQTTPEATNEKKNFWNLGVIGSRVEGDIHIRGIFQAGTNGSQSLGLALHYEHPTYHSSFVVKRESVVNLSDQDMQRIQIEGPPSLHSGESYTYTIRYTDFTDLGNLDAVSVQVNLPAGFTLTEQKPAPQDSNSWTAGALQALLDPLTHEGTITLKGLVGTAELGPQHIVTKVVQKNANGSPVTLFERDTEVQILGGDLVLSLGVQNKTAPAPIQFGSKVPLTLSFENKGTTTYHNVTLTLTRKGSLALFSQVDAPGATKDTDHIVWSASAVKALATLAPQAKGDISFVLPIDTMAALDQMQFAPSDLSVSLAVTAQSEKQEDLDGKNVEQPTDISGPTLILPLLSDARFDAFAKKVPPTDGSPASADTIRVYWSLENTLHEINTIRMEAVIPKGVQWIGEHARTAGDISYTSGTRVVAWTLNKLPVSVHRIDGSFDLKLIQASKDTVVVRDARLSAQDSVVSGAITQTIPVLTMP